VNSEAIEADICQSCLITGGHKFRFGEVPSSA
jgi:hypothetical protein